jgi:Ferritin-like domain
METMATRRQLVSGGIAAAAAASVFSGVGVASAASTPARSDSQVLAGTLGIEQLVVTAYRQVLATDVLEAPMRNQLETLFAQELEHVTTLEQALARLGASGPGPPPNLQIAQAELNRHHIYWSLAHLKRQHDCLKLLVDVESLAENAYFEAIAKLADPGRLRMSAEIMGAEAQHWTVLSGALHHNDVLRAVPYPFVGGAP